MTVHTSLGGNKIRLRISNAFGTLPLVVGAVDIATATGPDTINTATDTPFTFGGAATVTVPTGGVVVSDAVSFPLQPNANYLVSIFTSSTTGNGTMHYVAPHVSYVAFGNSVSSGQMPNEFAYGSSTYFISGLDVVGGVGSNFGMVAVGDSITDGYGATPGTDTSWPDALSNRLFALTGNTFAVANTGTSSSRLLADFSPGNIPGGLARMNSDILALPGISYVILALGINDIGMAGSAASPSANDVVAGYRQFVARAHEFNINVFGATITPAGNSSGYSNAVFEAKRQAINTAIRSGSIFDQVVDFDAAVRDPNAPSQLLAAYDSGDHLHPNSAGYKAMANVVGQ